MRRVVCGSVGVQLTGAGRGLAALVTSVTSATCALPHAAAAAVKHAAVGRTTSWSNPTARSHSRALPHALMTALAACGSSASPRVRIFATIATPLMV